MLGQSVGACTDATHGMTLAAVSLPYYRHIMPYGLAKFVRFAKNVWDVDVTGKTVAAQIVAFACGKEDENRNKYFPGGRPSSIIIGQQLTPEALGALLAHFENKVMFQGFAWNLNSFDQEGVQLGKVLAKKVLAHETDGALQVYSELLNI